ncbi:Uncharacterised protein [Vibrio cholerae]|nr:Uncharacterised protein [Vibrio cholerae]CSI87234.1 Uncharacterised protein [Vibrio cholerae]
MTSAKTDLALVRPSIGYALAASMYISSCEDW